MSGKRRSKSPNSSRVEVINEFSKQLSLEPKVSKEGILERSKTAKSTSDRNKQSLSPKEFQSQSVDDKYFELMPNLKRHHHNHVQKKDSPHLNESVELNTNKINYLNEMLTEIGQKIETEKANEEMKLANYQPEKSIFNHFDLIYKNFHNLPSILPRITKRYDNPEAEQLILNRPSYKNSYRQSGSYQHVS